MGKIRAIAKTERNDCPYVLLWEASKIALKRAREHSDRVNCMSVLIFSAFCLEGYLNYIGSMNPIDWEEVQWKKPKPKLKSICDRLEYSLDLGRRPFQTFSEIMDYRNMMVHAKSDHISETKEVEIDIGNDVPEMKLADWEKITNLDIAEKFSIDTDLMIRDLHKAAKFDSDPFQDVLYEGWSLTPIKEETQ